MSAVRFYYYTGPVLAGDAEFMGEADQQAAKALVRKMHRLRQSIERDGSKSRLSPEAEKRIDDELQRREYAGRTALVRVLQCSKNELDDISATVFDALPDILLIEQH